MSKSIKVGDLVMVVKPSACCMNSSSIGTVFTVISIEQCTSNCTECGDESNDTLILDTDDGGYPINRLIKIDPPSLPETVTENEEIPA